MDLSTKTLKDKDFEIIESHIKIEAKYIDEGDQFILSKVFSKENYDSRCSVILRIVANGLFSPCHEG
jgi:hypothetical protein